MTTYPNPPIIEAVIDWRVQNRPDLTLDSLLEVHHKLQADFPDVRVLKRGDVQLQMGESIHESKSISTRGYGFVSEGGEQMCQFRLDGFSFHRLRPYSDWDSVFGAADALWNIYRDNVSPSSVTRIALRYINQIEVPGPPVVMNDFFTVSPAIIPNVSGPVSSFLSRVQMLDAKTRNTATVTFASERSEKEGLEPVILDIDVFRQKEIDPSDSPAMDKIFADLRELKNRIFESSITDRTRELFL